MHRSCLLLAAALLGAAPAAAQQDFSKVEIKVEKLAPGVAVLFGAGGNIGLSYGADGNVLIDDQFAPLTSKILAAVKSLDPDPVTFVVNTHWHGDHSGGNENLGKAGAVIVAHDNVRRRMSVEQMSKRFGATAASPKAALPVVTWGSRPGLVVVLSLLARLWVMAMAYTPGRVLGMTPTVEDVTMTVRTHVAPAVLLTVWVWLLRSGVRAGSRPRPAGRPRGS